MQGRCQWVSWVVQSRKGREDATQGNSELTMTLLLHRRPLLDCSRRVQVEYKNLLEDYELLSGRRKLVSRHEDLS